MFIAKYYLLVAIIAFGLALLLPTVVLTAFFGWIGLSFLLVTIAYFADIPSIFRKNDDGKIASWIRWAFIPFLLSARAYNAIARRNDPVPPIQKVQDNLFLSRRLFPSDLEQLERENITCIVDVTAEFSGLESAMTDKTFDYLAIPTLDHKVPSLRKLRHALNWIDCQIQQSRSVVVHCALGRGRSVFVVAAYLLSKDNDLTVEQVLKQLNDIRQTARLNKAQIKVLHAIRRKEALKLAEPTWLVANPVSGGGKWLESKEHLIRELTKKHRLAILETREDVSAKTLTQQAIAQGATTILAAGGDGTVTEVATQLVKTDIALGIIPLGTANALCHILYGVSSKISPVETACNTLLYGEVKKIDTATCNDHLMLLVLGIGFEQEMIEYAHREQKNAMGQFAYLTGFFNAVVSGSQQQITLTLDDEEPQTIETHSLVIANTAPFSTMLAQGGAQPQADDGKLHISHLDSDTSLADRIFAISDLTLSSLGLKDKSAAFKYIAAKRIEVSAKQAIDYVIDGELYSDDKLVIEIHPKTLNTFVPKS
ncbi:diacylglycerol kinase family protein [Thalassotalea marina]|uniref:Diacylglycerol kinase catalytic subunit n=1 Tax=Thalassotalea marina TaxID=1673741 RepID=A0A919BRF9_9GAMM|nr:diacylglycerol kinase family protein [Thalassotalea marina]GHG05086.1 diacylglycerol kinase catalytic subunit [Thalassotalea marina]